MNNDLKNYKDFKMLVSQADFNIKGGAIVKVALLLRWFDEMEKKFIEKPVKKGKR